MNRTFSIHKETIDTEFTIFKNCIAEIRKIEFKVDVLNYYTSINPTLSSCLLSKYNVEEDCEKNSLRFNKIIQNIK